MGPKDLAHVFEPFFPLRERGQGNGMGLAAAYGIIKQSGGRIEAAGEQGRGTTFTIYLPAAPAPAPGAESGAANPNAPARGTVLLVEDEPAVRSLTRQVLQEQGYTVLEAPGGAEALDLASRHGGPINLLLTDLSMPEMSGFEVAHRVLDRRPETRVLFMSGYAEECAQFSEPIRGRRPRFLAKPFRLADLLRQVRETINAREG
jgi:CheY-like chemotaxis protein